jgi:hypothetical protein
MPSKILAIIVTIATMLLAMGHSTSVHELEFPSRAETTVSVHPAPFSGGLPSGTVLLITSDTMWIVDPEDLHLEFYGKLVSDLKTSWIILSKNAEKIYYVQSPVNRPTPRDEITITQVDTTTQTRKVIWQTVGFIDLDLSPNGSKAIVVHPLEVETFRNGSPLTFCILDITSGECLESNLRVYRTQWIDDDTVVTLSMNQRRISKVNAATLEVEELFESWAISQVAFVPSRNELLIAEKPSADHEIEFAVLNWSTSVASVLPYGVEDVYCPALDYLSVSPDGQYMIYSCAGPRVLADYQTGKSIAEFEHMGFSQWSADSKSIIAFLVNEEARSLVRIDVPTGKLVASVDFPGRGVLVTVP